MRIEQRHGGIHGGGPDCTGSCEKPVGQAAGACGRLARSETLGAGGSWLEERLPVWE